MTLHSPKRKLGPSDRELETVRLSGKAIAARLRASDRGFPWRQTRDPYIVCVSEILLQKTGAQRAAAIVSDLLRHYPDWASLAVADLDHLQGILRPLGFHRRRAAGLKVLATRVLARGGLLPENTHELEALPFVGPYVASAVAAVCWDMRLPMVDANVRRVLGRLLGREFAHDPRRDARLRALASAFTDQGANPARTNWAIIDFAHTICKARAPACELCPVQPDCRFFQAMSKSG